MKFFTSSTYISIQNYKNSKPFELSKYKKTTKFPRINDYKKSTKKDKRKKKKEGVLQGCLLFSFLLFCWFLIIVDPTKCVWFQFGRFLYFDSSKGFEFLKFWIIPLFGRYTGMNLVLNIYLFYTIVTRI